MSVTPPCGSERYGIRTVRAERARVVCAVCAEVCRASCCGTSRAVEAPIVEAVGLRKRYDKHEVVCGVDFTVRPRECFGLLGPNGAGKTTTIRMLTCFSPIDAGSLRVFGLPVNPAN